MQNDGCCKQSTRTQVCRVEGTEQWKLGNDVIIVSHSSDRGQVVAHILTCEIETLIHFPYDW